MKNKMIFMMLTLAVAGKVLAQTDEIRPLSKFALVSTTDGSKGIQVGEDISKAIEAFGQPSGVEDFYFEIDEKMAKLYTFSSNRLYALDDKLVSYEIVNDSMAIGEKNGSCFKVGEKITTTTNLTFHGFPIEAKTGVLNYKNYENNINYTYISVVFLAQGTNVLVDDYCYLYFNSNKELVHVNTATDG